MIRVGFLGPFGTFNEQAVRSQPDLTGAELIPYRTVPDVLDDVTAGVLDVGFVPMENSIEGTVNFTQDALAFDHDLRIQREVVIDIEHCLIALPGTELDEITTVYSFPVATAQCHQYLRKHFPNVEIRASTSTAQGAQLIATHHDGSGVAAAVAPRAAADLYGLDVLAADIADHGGNQTRFVLVACEGIPAPTGHDRTCLVVYQRADQPGSLISILQEFAARRINLSNLLSRPIKTSGLGDYCFIVYADAHVADEVMADAMRALYAKQARVKFLGSYPAAGNGAHDAREHADARSREADDWIAALRSSIGPRLPGV